MKEFFPKHLLQIKDEVLRKVEDSFQRVDSTALQNTARILAAFRKYRVSELDFRQTTGYGYGDVGRDKLSAIWAEIFGCEAALVRPQFVSGTHAIATALFAVLRPGDELLSITGTPYDTLCTVIGLSDPKPGCLKEFNVSYRETPFEWIGDLPRIIESIGPATRMILIQRSCGYSQRKSLSTAEVGRLCYQIHDHKPDCVILVDNCYGEFTESMEPSQVGADLTAGSLIKNPGGGLAPTGGYIAGGKKWVDLCAARLTAPGIGAEVGSSADGYRLYYQGLFMAPHVTAQAIKGAIFAAAFFSRLGYGVFPDESQARYDIIQRIELGSPEKLLAFCRGLQKYSPVDSFLKPEPAPMPGYTDPVIMACGAFIQGASIELSADAPLREPYAVYLQGGLTFEHSQLAYLGAATEMMYPII